MFRGLVFCAIAVMASVSQAATVKFAGTYDTYIQIAGAADPASFLNRSFLATLETDGGAGIVSGQIWFTGPNQTVTLAGGSISTTATTTVFGGITPSTGTSLKFTVNQVLAGFSQANLLALTGAGGTSILSGGFATGTGSYVGTITAVPEPASMLALAGLVVGCVGVSFRRRQSKLAV
jgi:hypothetical protein